ncbi:tetraacyldisaccharide 4'-kinase [Glaciecola sp. HTCC2999]|uniref:tetraacyldisaccharide 4'-kinase n=1 Tax=Glaciecola sp. HTCC2999 TaxID=455436 RepID=UPI0000E0E9B5|nr:tetraacyldisaccharide 4'-kinase [Glaciecola sp. HTCC2999]
MNTIERAWSKQAKWLYLLAPLSALFCCLSTIRRVLYNINLKASHKLDVPVIVVGNISVGGNGKTPTVLAIVEHLIAQGYQPGILSRGYGGACKRFPYRVKTDDVAQYVGDEPLLMAQETNVPVIIDPNRVRGGQQLAKICDVIVCDDGLQHYALQRDIEIVVMDERRVGNGWLLPVGNLRELPQRLNDVDFIIINSATLQHPNEYYMELTPQSIIPLLNSEDKQSEHLPSKFDFIMTGIGNPRRFEETCDRLNIQYANSLFYDDHFAYSPADVPSGVILMTQKDAVKCRAFALPSWYYLPVKASFSGDFLVQLSDKLRLLR